MECIGLLKLVAIFSLQYIVHLSSAQQAQCGVSFQSIGTRITSPSSEDDSTDPHGTWPWMVSAGVVDKSGKWSHFCGGTILSDRYVLTAAHCTTKDKMFLRMGDNNLNSIEDDLGSYIRRIRRTHVHPRYEGGGKSPAYYDVAIWEVTPRITYNSYVRPVCLPAASSSFADKYEGFAATVTGWGFTSRSSGEPENVLRRVPIRIFPQRYCNETHSRGLSVAQESDIENYLPSLFQSNIMCAGYERPMFGPCKGDSGSPLVRFDFSGSGSQPKYVITGIVQGGVGRCGDDKFPSIFVRVEDPEVYNFIAKTIGVQGSTSQVSAVSQRIRTTTTTTTRSPPTTTTPSSEQGLKKVVGLAQDALYEVFKLTISQGVPIDEPNNEGNTHLLTTAKVGNLKTVKLLVDTGANINRVNNLGQNAVLMAARNNGTSDEIVRYFVERGVNYFLKDKNGNNALSLAADVGNLPSVKYLYSKGLSIESADNDGETALMLASFKHFFKTAEYLLEKGASPRVVTNNGLNALHQVGISGDVPIARILIDKGANLNAQSEFGFTAFFYAAGHGHLDLVKYLKRRGANINITSVKNETPLLNAARYGHSDVVSWLLKEAPSQAYVKDNDGNTPVSEASKNNREETLKILLDSGLFRAAG